MSEQTVSRRDLLKSMAIASATIALPSALTGVAHAAGSDEINVALIGAGAQGRVLLNDALRIPGVNFKAVCDIWPYSSGYAARRLKGYKQIVTEYEDVKEMLAKEKNLHAAIVATPDFVHAEHTNACLEAGLHVYCEKEMAHSLECSLSMVKTAQKTGKLLQIGHQRRSNPVYQQALALINEGACGKITTCYGQWNRTPEQKDTVPEKLVIPADKLKKYGYDSFDHFRNWRWYKKYSSGPLADLGSHQIDIFAWFLGCEASSVMASGNSDYYKDREWYCDVLALYEYAAKTGSVRAFYQVVSTNGFGGYYERFCGDKGTITISENAKMCCFTPEPDGQTPAWMEGIDQVPLGGATGIPLVQALPKKDAATAALMADFEKKNVHQLHLENFVAAIRAKDKKLLNCPAEVAYPTAVAVLSAIPAAQTGTRIALTEDKYKI